MDWYYKVSHPRLVAPPPDEVREVPVPFYDEGSSHEKLSFISHEFRRYLHRNEAYEEDDEFAEIFRSPCVAQGGPSPRRRPITFDDKSDT